MSEFKKRDIDNALKIVQLKLKLGMIGNSKARFDMSTGFSMSCDVGEAEGKHYCSSIGCIGGYVEVELGVIPWELLGTVEEQTSRLYKLFYPTGYGIGQDDDWKYLKSKKAIKAIQNYLDGKADPWKDVAKRNTNKTYLKNL